MAAYKYCNYMARVNSGSNIICDMLEENESNDVATSPANWLKYISNFYVLHCLEIKRTIHISAKIS